MHQPHMSLPRPSSGEKSPEASKYSKYTDSKSITQKYKEVISSFNNKKGLQKSAENSVSDFTERKLKVQASLSRVQTEKDRDRLFETNKYYNDKGEDVRYEQYDKREYSIDKRDYSIDKRQFEKDKRVEKMGYNDKMKDYDDEMLNERIR